jgi:hypothetical protein
LWTGRRALELRCDWRALTLEPGAVVTVEGQSGRWQIERSEWEAMGVRLSLRQVGGAGVLAPPADAGTAFRRQMCCTGPRPLLVADLPMPGDELLTAPLVVAAAAGAQAGWRGAELFVEDAVTGGLTSIGGTAPSAIMGDGAGDPFGCGVACPVRYGLGDRRAVAQQRDDDAGERGRCLAVARAPIWRWSAMAR